MTDLEYCAGGGPAGCLAAPGTQPTGAAVVNTPHNTIRKLDGHGWHDTNIYWDRSHHTAHHNYDISVRGSTNWTEIAVVVYPWTEAGTEEQIAIN
jgi:hypothetical protein